MVWAGLDAVAPRFEDLTDEEKRAIRARDLDALTPRLIEIIGRDLWEQNLDPAYLSSRSFGFQIQHKARERVLRLLRPETLHIDVHSEVRPLSDSALLELLAGLGIRVMQNRDSASSLDAAGTYEALPPHTDEGPQPVVARDAETEADRRAGPAR